MDDFYELRRHVYTNTVDSYTVRKLVGKIFPICQCQEQKQRQQPSSETPPPSDSINTLPSLNSPRECAGHELAIPVKEMVQSMDVSEECISTLLCYLELQGWLEVMNVINDNCTLKCSGGSRQLKSLIKKVPAVAVAAEILRENGK